MATIEAGPVELFSNDSKITVALMGDHTISQRKYLKKSGDLVEQQVFPSHAKDLDAGISALMAKIEDLKNGGFSTEESEQNTVSGTKRTA